MTGWEWRFTELFERFEISVLASLQISAVQYEVFDLVGAGKTLETLGSILLSFAWCKTNNFLPYFQDYIR